MRCLTIDTVHSSISGELGKYTQADTHMLPSQQELAKLTPDYDVLAMRVDPTINKEILDVARDPKAIGVCSAGLNHVNLKTAEAKGTQVFNASGLNANTVAEPTLSKMLDIARHTTPTDADVKVNKNWDKYKFVGSKLRGKTLGILGFGRIGRRVGELGRVFLTDVVVYDPFLKPGDFEKENAKGMNIDELLEVSDYISIHIPLAPDTRNPPNAESIAKMRSDAVVLNMSRGGIVNEQDMYEALEANEIGGYATDIMENELAACGLGEGASSDSPLLECGNFTATPHLSAWSLDASHDIGVFITAKLKEALNLN